ERGCGDVDHDESIPTNRREQRRFISGIVSRLWPRGFVVANRELAFSSLPDLPRLWRKACGRRFCKASGSGDSLRRDRRSCLFFVIGPTFASKWYVTLYASFWSSVLLFEMAMVPATIRWGKYRLRSGKSGTAG
ncbi:MAG: hypothetical protein AAFU85_28550, partial [Planctomycetota bacterium]